MVFVLGWIIFSIVAGAIGTDRKCGFATPFFLSLILSPLVGIIIALASTKNSTIEFQKNFLIQQSDIQARQSFESANREEYLLELGKLTGLLEAGTITAVEYEERREKLKNRQQNLVEEKSKADIEAQKIKDDPFGHRVAAVILLVVLVVLYLVFS